MQGREERFKVRWQSPDGVVYFTEVSGEEIFTHRGFRFFSHRYLDENGVLTWRVTCAASGMAIGWSCDRDSAVTMGIGKVVLQFDKYISKLKARPRACWRGRKENNESPDRK